MKAIVYTRYGPPDVLQLQEVDRPAPKEDEALVRVHAASVNYGDWSFVRGKPLLVRLIGAGLLRPRHRILGADIAGRVEEVGSGVQRFRPGDEVFADISAAGFGGFAEYACAPADILAAKPANLTFEEAAAVPMAAVVALQGLRDEGDIQPGQQVLINGASGGIGTFAVQMAKAFGAEVTGVCGTRNLDMVRSIGADQVMDYTQEDFTDHEESYDLILDVVASRSASDYVRALRPGGTCVVVGYSSPAAMYRLMLQQSRTSGAGGKKVRSLAAKPRAEDLDVVRELIEAGKVVPVIGKRFPLSRTADAVRYYGERHPQGKVVIAV